MIFIQPWQQGHHPTVSQTRVRISCCLVILPLKRPGKVSWWNSSVWMQSTARGLWGPLLWRSNAPDKDGCQRSPGGCSSAIMRLCIMNQLSQRLKGTYPWLTSAKSTSCLVNIRWRVCWSWVLETFQHLNKSTAFHRELICKAKAECQSGVWRHSHPRLCSGDLTDFHLNRVEYFIKPQVIWRDLPASVDIKSKSKADRGLMEAKSMGERVVLQVP